MLDAQELRAPRVVLDLGPLDLDRLAAELSRL